MSKKQRYEVKTSCPQCGCTMLTVLSDEEIKERYGDNPLFHMDCGECQAQFDKPRADVCPEWDKECQMKEDQG